LKTFEWVKLCPVEINSDCLNGSWLTLKKKNSLVLIYERIFSFLILNRECKRALTRSKAADQSLNFLSRSQYSDVSTWLEPFRLSDKWSKIQNRTLKGTNGPCDQRKNNFFLSIWIYYRDFWKISLGWILVGTSSWNTNKYNYGFIFTLKMLLCLISWLRLKFSCFLSSHIFVPILAAVFAYSSTDVLMYSKL